MVNLGVYYHHGIACGDGTAIHFGRGIFDIKNAVIEQVDLATFSQGKPIQIVESRAIFEPNEIVERAKSRLGERSYDLWDNNCEHFATWCRSNEHESPQISITETIVRQTAAVAAKPLLKKLASSTAGRGVGAAASGIAKGPMIVAGVADVVQATVEVVATQKGKTKDESQQAGRTAGAASSLALGWMVGGPVTAAAGVGIWFVGQMIAEQAVDAGKQIVNSAVNTEEDSETGEG